MIDASRKFDLEEIAKRIEEARSTGERELFEKLAYRIVNESTEIGVLRNDLIRATRANDVRAIRMIQSRIQKIKMDETNGKSWGNDKGNRFVN